MIKKSAKSIKKTVCLLLSCGLIFAGTGCNTGSQPDNPETENSSEPTSPADSSNTPGTVKLTSDFRTDDSISKKAGSEKSGSQKKVEMLEDSFLYAAADFSVRLFQQANAEKTADNMMISPFSILTALSMTANGAKGDTQKEMLQTMFPGQSPDSKQQKSSDSGNISLDKMNQNMSCFLSQLSSTEHARLLQANSIWFRDDASSFQVNRDFLQTNEDYYQAELYSAPFDLQTVSDINHWVSDHTEQRIPQVLDQIPSDAVMYLINALSFDAVWQSPYTEDSISEQIFTNRDGSISNVPTMHSEENLYLQMEHATGFIKPYQEGYSFAALLPEEGLSIDDFVKDLKADALLSALSHVSGQTILTSIPKFSSEYDTELSNTLKTMGMKIPFDNRRADFSHLGNSGINGPIYISRILHKTSITVDEKGTQAGAATAIEMTLESCIINQAEVYLNRPFVYLIIDQSTNLPIFMGTITQLPE